MKDYLRDNWLWIVIPFVLVLAVVIYLVVGSDGGSASPFTYGQ